MKNFLMMSLMFSALGTPVLAHGFQQPSSLLGALVQVGNRGGIANAAAGVASPHALADVKLNVLGAVKADIDVAPSSRHGGSLLDLNASVLGGGVGNRRDHW